MKAGDIVLYKRRGCDSYELGVVKNTLDDGSAFVWYSGGDTAARTPADCLFGFDNPAASVVSEHAGRGTCRMRYDPVHCDYVCTACGEWHNTGMYDACDADDVILLRPYKYCPNCGAKVVDE